MPMPGVPADSLPGSLRASASSSLTLFGANAGLANSRRGDVAGLVDALRHEDPDVVRESVEALGEIGDPRALEALLRAIEDSNDHVRVAAATALGAFPDVRAREALLEASRLRFRPIMMTAITTVGGMVPLALAGANSIGLSYTSFSLALIGGMTTATILTLLVVPVFYTFFDDARDILQNMVRRGARSRRPVPELASPPPDPVG